MFKYDSTHGIFKGTIRVVDESTLEINGKQVKVSNKRYCWTYLIKGMFVVTVCIVAMQSDCHYCLFHS